MPGAPPRQHQSATGRAGAAVGNRLGRFTMRPYAAASVEQMRLFKERYPDGRIAVLADRYHQSQRAL